MADQLTDPLAPLRERRDAEAAMLARLRADEAACRASLAAIEQTRDTQTSMVMLADAMLAHAVIALSAFVVQPTGETKPEPPPVETPRSAPGQVRAAVLDFMHTENRSEEWPVSAIAVATAYDTAAVSRACIALTNEGKLEKIKRGVYRRKSDTLTIREIAPRPEGGEAAPPAVAPVTATDWQNVGIMAAMHGEPRTVGRGLSAAQLAYWLKGYDGYIEARARQEDVAQ